MTSGRKKDADNILKEKPTWSGLLMFSPSSIRGQLTRHRMTSCSCIMQWRLAVLHTTGTPMKNEPQMWKRTIKTSFPLILYWNTLAQVLTFKQWKEHRLFCRLHHHVGKTRQRTKRKTRITKVTPSALFLQWLCWRELDHKHHVLSVSNLENKTHRKFSQLELLNEWEQKLTTETYLPLNIEVCTFLDQQLTSFCVTHRST